MPRKGKTPIQNSSVARIIGKHFKVLNDDGTMFVVPAGKEENQTANKILASQMRSILQESIKEYKTKGAILSPTDLKNLAEAAKSVVTISGEVYSDGESLIDSARTVNPETPEETPAGALDFNDMTPDPIETSAVEEEEEADEQQEDDDK